MTTPSARPAPLAWPVRLLFGASAFGLTALYALSFLGLGVLPESCARLPAWIGLASGASWLVFGAALLGPGRRYAAPLEWADSCLRTMLDGNLILLISVAFNLSRVGVANDPSHLGIHLAILLAADAAMATRFTLQARHLSAPAGFALGWYLGALNGAFAAILVAAKLAGAW